MEKRVLFAVVLSFVVLYGYQAMFPPPEPVGSAEAGSAPPVSDPAAANQTPATTPGSPTATEPLEKPASAEPTVAAATAEDIVVESEAVRATFTTRGGALKSWRLKNYLDANGEPLELVPIERAAGRSCRSHSALTIRRPPRRCARAVQAKRRRRSRSVMASGSGVRIPRRFGIGRTQGVFDSRRQTVHGRRLPRRSTRDGSPIAPIVHWGPGLGQRRDRSAA